MSNIQKSQVFASLLLVLVSCQKSIDHGFSTGLEPVWTNPRTIQTAESCKSCHTEIYSEWQTSRHRVAFTNTLYQESHAREPLQWCENCHAPLVSKGLDSSKRENRLLSEEGVSCNVCHVREGKILTKKQPPNAKAHSYVEVKEMKNSDFCANCHQFPFPVGTGAVPHNKLKFSTQLMQGTFEEWQSSSYANRENCQDCHMETKKTYRSHAFPGGHNLELLNKALSVDFKTKGDHSFIVLRGNGIGHGFPTGDLFRTIVVRFLDNKGQEVYRQNFKYNYVTNKEAGAGDSAKRLFSKTVLPPPTTGESSWIEMPLPSWLPKTSAFYELRIKYISDDNVPATKLKESEYMPVIRKAEVIWIREDSEKGDG